MGGGLEQRDGTGGKQRFPLPAGLGLGAVQAGVLGHPCRLHGLMGRGVKGIDADGMEPWLQAHVRFQQRQ
ncbi:hypothetical protein D3C75_1253230 [compost metagenome]